MIEILRKGWVLFLLIAVFFAMGYITYSYGATAKVSRLRERIKNHLLFKIDRLDANNPVHVALAEKVAANATIALGEALEDEAATGSYNATVTAVLNGIAAKLKEDAVWWNPDEVIQE